jgi:uncharacterized damage-inducible protein DinB
MRAIDWKACAAVMITLGVAASAQAQSRAMDGIRGEFADVKASVVAAAQKAPDTLYGYQPTPDVYTFRKMLLHIADASYSICSGFKGTPGQRPKVDADAMLPKSDVLATVNAAFTFCDDALAAATDATLAEEVKTPRATRVKSYYASHLLAHTSLHYGNLVTYLRLNKIAPGD